MKRKDFVKEINSINDRLRELAHKASEVRTPSKRKMYDVIGVQFFIAEANAYLDIAVSKAVSNKKSQK